MTTLLQRHDSLRRVLTVALQDRAGLTSADIESIAARLGVQSPKRNEPADMAAFPPPPYDPELVYAKSLTCPACATKFSALVPQPRKDQPAARATDFHQVYRTDWNPYDYEVWVCPNDLYATLQADAGELTETQQSQVTAIVEETVIARGGLRPDFNVDRNLELREYSLHLALALYRMRGLPPVRVAAILHRLAWCARERGDADAEQSWLVQALEAYTTAYSKSDLKPVREELRVLYLCGELSARTGDPRGAIQWFSEALRGQKVVGHPNWERMIRDRWSEIRAAAE